MKTKLTYGISFPDPRILDGAKSRAAQIGISFSAYVNQLLRRDLGQPNALSLYTQPPQPLQVVEEPLARYGAKAEARRKRRKPTPPQV